MKVTLPKGRSNDLPTQAEIAAVMNGVCQVIGFDPNGVTLSVNGGDPNHHPDRIGLRFVNFGKHNNFSVFVRISCRNKVVNGYLMYAEKSTSIHQNQLYQRLARHFASSNDKFISVNAKQPQLASIPKGFIEPEPVEDFVAGAFGRETGAVVTTERFRTPPAEFALSTSGSVSVGSGEASDYKDFFTQEENVHLAVVALVTKFEAVSTLFGFPQFVEVMRDDVGIILEPMKMSSMVGRFTRLGYIVRSNPGLNPARYRITEEAIKYASSVPSVDSTKKRQVHRRQLPPKADLPASGPARQDNLVGFVEGFALLKSASADFLTLKAQIDTRNAELGKMNLANLQKESESISSQIAKLNQEIERLMGREAEIKQIGSNAIRLQSEITALMDQIRDQDLEAKHKRFLAERETAKRLSTLLSA